MRRDIPQGVTVSTSFFQVGLFSHLSPPSPPRFGSVYRKVKRTCCLRECARTMARHVRRGWLSMGRQKRRESYRLDVSRKSHTRGICGSALILIDVRVPFIALDVVYIERRFIEYLSIRQMKYCFPYPWRFSSWDFCGIFDSMSKLSGDLLFFFFFQMEKKFLKKRRVEIMEQRKNRGMNV